MINHQDSNLFNSWNNRLKITPKDLEFRNKQSKDLPVSRREDLKNKYLGSLVSCINLPGYINLLEDNNIGIIEKNHSVILKCNGNPVGAVIRDAAPTSVLKHFGAKIKVTLGSHYPIKRGAKHISYGLMAAHGSRANRTNPPTDTYAYKEDLDPHEQRVYDMDGNTLGKWLFEYGKNYLPDAALSYEVFKDNLNLDDDDFFGAVFCTKNYQAAGHVDKDRSEWAIGYVYDEGDLNNNDGYFFYPEYGVAIELASNSIWCWLTQAVHGTAKLNTESGNRYTAVLTLTERTATSIENRKKKENN